MESDFLFCLVEIEGCRQHSGELVRMHRLCNVNYFSKDKINSVEECPIIGVGPFSPTFLSNSEALILEDDLRVMLRGVGEKESRSLSCRHLHIWYRDGELILAQMTYSSWPRGKAEDNITGVAAEKL